MIPNKIVSIFVGVFLTLGSVYLALLSWNAVKAHDYIGVSPKTPHSISITGEGKITGVPDVAKIQLGYSIVKNTVAEAQKDNTAKMNGMVEKLKKDFKIDAQDIKTLNYSITPQYDWVTGRQILKGYTVSQEVSVKLRDLDKVSQILDAAGQIGMNQVGSLSFEIDQPEQLKQQAREAAIKQAKDKADTLAEVVGVKLGKIISFSESTNQTPAPYYDNYRKLESSAAIGGASPMIEVGSNEITIIATVEYEIL
ncbi:MAG: SIMPL domain-containing protein [Patescibacteria group bacterium]|nr:SIMPL domain-containing protein [Patescibacteria group bacterium]